MNTMKNNKIKNIIGAFLLSSVGLASCDNAEYSVLNKQAFIMQTNTNPNTSVKVFIDQDEVNTDINVRMTDIAQKDLAFEMVEDEDLLKKFNQENFTSYLSLPKAQYSINSNNLIVKAGKSISEAMSIHIQPLTEDMKNSGNKYALAYTLKSKNNETDILAPGSNIVYLLDPAIVTSVPIFSKSNNGSLNLKEELALSTWTVEYCVNMSKLGKGIGESNNQAIFAATSKYGADDGEIYIRFGDAPIEGNRLQIKTQGSQMNSNMLFEENKWYHIAWVCSGTKLELFVDGKLDNTIDLPGVITNIDKRIKIGNTDYLVADMKLSEMRIWKRALTQREVANNMYATNPESDGLYAYFKFNEGKGKDFADATDHDNKGTCDAEQWSQKERLNSK